MSAVKKIFAQNLPLTRKEEKAAITAKAPPELLPTCRRNKLEFYTLDIFDGLLPLVTWPSDACKLLGETLRWNPSNRALASTIRNSRRRLSV